VLCLLRHRLSSTLAAKRYEQPHPATFPPFVRKSHNFNSAGYPRLVTCAIFFACRLGKPSCLCPICMSAGNARYSALVYLSRRQLGTVDHGRLGGGGNLCGMATISRECPRCAGLVSCDVPLAKSGGSRCAHRLISAFIEPVVSRAHACTRRLTLKGVLLRSEAEPANIPLVEQARFYWRPDERRAERPTMALVFWANWLRS